MPRKQATIRYDNFADHLRAARELRLDISQKQAGDMIGLSDLTWRKMEKGEKVAQRTYYRAGQVVGWTPEDVDNILAGGDPPEVEQLADPRDTRIALLERRVNVLIERVEEMAAAIRRLDGQEGHGTP